MIRPDVVLFGEILPPRKVEAYRRELDRGFDVVVSIGTSAQFPYIAQPVMIAASGGVPTIDINPERTPLADIAAVRLEMPAVPALQAITERMGRS
jgi:NAD-dependent deacetylase